MQPTDQTTPTAIAPDVITLARDNSAFACDLYAQLRSDEGNLAFSPYSISAVLGLLHAGADSDTAAQIAHVLRWSLPPDRIHNATAALSGVLQQISRRGDVRLSSANALFPHHQYPLLPGFLAVTQEYHGVSVTPLDYSQPENARETINSWVEERTERRITNLIPEGAIEPLTRLVLANAVYFKGNWSCQFDPADTRQAPFWLTSRERVDVDMMWQGEHFMLAQTDRLKVLELPYRDRDLSMLLILPNARDGLAQIEAELSPSRLAEWRDACKHTDVDLLLPRFRVEWGTPLDAVLRSMGMVDAFDASRADFSRIDGRTAWLYVGLVVHKAFVEVNEEGTEAAAATAAVSFARSAFVKPQPTEFHADHPFLFVLIERQTGSILFKGRVVDPRAD